MDSAKLFLLFGAYQGSVRSSGFYWVNIIELDEEKKAAMVSNLMVVLCGDKETQPIVNAGTLNH